jgi:hypothetical protein
MQDESHSSFDVFLVEDVILTLGNLRGSLGWLADPAPADDPALHRAGLERIGRQIALLEDRARAMRRRMGQPQDHAVSAYAPPDASSSDRDADTAWEDEENIFAEPHAERDEPAQDQTRRIVFRSHRPVPG